VQEERICTDAAAIAGLLAARNPQVVARAVKIWERIFSVFTPIAVCLARYHAQSRVVLLTEGCMPAMRSRKMRFSFYVELR